jgi:hypothetical protein
VGRLFATLCASAPHGLFRTIVDNKIAVILHDRVCSSLTFVVDTTGPGCGINTIILHQVVVTLHDQAMGAAAFAMSIAGP